MDRSGEMALTGYSQQSIDLEVGNILSQQEYERYLHREVGPGLEYYIDTPDGGELWKVGNTYKSNGSRLLLCRKSHSILEDKQDKLYHIGMGARKMTVLWEWIPGVEHVSSNLLIKVRSVADLSIVDQSDKCVFQSRVSPWNCKLLMQTDPARKPIALHRRRFFRRVGFLDVSR